MTCMILSTRCLYSKVGGWGGELRKRKEKGRNYGIGMDWIRQKYVCTLGFSKEGYVSKFCSNLNLYFDIGFLTLTAYFSNPCVQYTLVFLVYSIL